jgi:hypothetical protein
MSLLDAPRRTYHRTAAALRRRRPDPLTSVVLTTPVFLAYHLGILLIDQRNGVDWVSGLTFQLLDASVPAYVGVSVGLCVALGLAVFLLRKNGQVRPQALLPIVAESGLWAVVMLVSVGFAVERFVPAIASGSAIAQLGPFEKLVMAAGAGFHEEVTFRVVLFSGGARLLQYALQMRALPAFAAAATASSLLFALVHHVGPFGESVTLAALSFRTLAGLFLCALYAARGFAVAVYTHALYDALVFFVL